MHVFPKNGPIVAIDIETAPTGRDLTHHQQEMLDKQIGYHMAKDFAGFEFSGIQPHEQEWLRNKTMSLHPFIGFICCVTLRKGMVQGGEVYYGDEKTFYGYEDGESEMLNELAAALSLIKDERFVTFHGKRFDVPYIKARMARHGIDVPWSKLNTTYPFSSKDHVDLSKSYEGCYATMAQLCDHLQVPGPKKYMKGDEVAIAIREQKISDVIIYNQEDVRATLDCFYATPRYML